MKANIPPDEPALTNERTDAASYADMVLAALSRRLRRLDERERGYLRDALREAFLDGECQGECRGIVLLSLCQARVRDEADAALVGRALALLLGDD